MNRRNFLQATLAASVATPLLSDSVRGDSVPGDSVPGDLVTTSVTIKSKSADGYMTLTHTDSPYWPSHIWSKEIQEAHARELALMRSLS